MQILQNWMSDNGICKDDVVPGVSKKGEEMCRRGITITAIIGFCSVMLAMASADSELFVVPIIFALFGLMNIAISFALYKAQTDYEEKKRIIDMYRFD